MDVGNHATDLLERILGSKVAAVTAVTANVVHQYEGVEDLCSALYRMENNALASVEASFCTDGARNEVEVTAHEKTLVLREMLGQGTGGVLSVVSGPYGQDLELEIESDGRNMYQGEITAFSEAILRDVEPPISGEDGLWSQRVVAAVYRSAESGSAKRPCGGLRLQVVRGGVGLDLDPARTGSFDEPAPVYQAQRVEVFDLARGEGQGQAPDHARLPRKGVLDEVSAVAPFAGRELVKLGLHVDSASGGIR